MEFRVRDGAEAMINAARKLLKNDTNRVLMQGDISNAYGSINRLAVLKAVRKHIPCLAPLCAVTVCERWHECCGAGARRKRKEE